MFKYNFLWMNPQKIGRKYQVEARRDSIAKVMALMEADGVPPEDSLSDEHLFLYGKLVLKSMGSPGRKDEFNRLLNSPSMAHAKERLTRIVITPTLLL